MSELTTIQTIRAGYPTPLGATHARFLDEVCLALGAQMFEKNAGDHTTLPNGKNVSLDVLIYRNQWVDVLGDAEGKAVPTWDPHPNPTGVFVNPLPLSAFDPVAPPVPPKPPEQPPVPPVDLSEVLKRLDGIAAEIRVVQDQNVKLADAVAHVQLPPIEWPVYDARILGQNVVLRPRK